MKIGESDMAKNYADKKKNGKRERKPNGQQVSSQNQIIYAKLVHTRCGE